MNTPFERYRLDCERANERERLLDPSRHRYRATAEGGCDHCGYPQAEHTYSAVDRAAAAVERPCPNCNRNHPNGCLDA